MTTISTRPIEETKQMRIFFSECAADYGTYTFPYTCYCELDIGDGDAEMNDALKRGFLPYTGNWGLGAGFSRQLFYMCRSLRVSTAVFQCSSENRRIQRKAADISLESVRPLAEVRELVESAEFEAFCCDYAKERFAGGSMTPARLRFVLSRRAATHLFTFVREGKAVAYVLANITIDALHYWYSFLDTSLRHESVGIFAMLSVLLWSKERGLSHVYLGTGYGAKALYKVRNFNAVEWFDGNSWLSDVGELKRRIAADGEPLPAGDRFKETCSL